jgi:hypothetical protein
MTAFYRIIEKAAKEYDLILVDMSSEFGSNQPIRSYFLRPRCVALGGGFVFVARTKKSCQP